MTTAGQVVAARNSKLSDGPVSQIYTYVWKTEKAWSRSCRRLEIRLGK
ncbi:MAG: hypothetical protein ACK5AZ_15805 [Bryobacteraceae bacterium]